MLLRKGVLKICSKFTGEHPCRSVISEKLLYNFIETILRHRCSPGNLLHDFRTLFPKNTSGWLFLKWRWLVVWKALIAHRSTICWFRKWARIWIVSFETSNIKRWNITHGTLKLHCNKNRKTKITVIKRIILSKNRSSHSNVCKIDFLANISQNSLENTYAGIFTGSWDLAILKPGIQNVRLRTWIFL